MTTTATPEGRHSLLLRKAQSVGTSPQWSMSRVLFIGGSVAIPVGLLLMILGWIGAARTVIVFNQLAYIASGCLIGLALVVLGGFMYFAYWQSLAIEAAEARESRLVAHQRDLLDRLDQLTLAILGEAGASAADTATSALVVTESGSMVHRAGCAIVRDRAGLRTVTSAEAADLKPCRICNPV